MNDFHFEENIVDTVRDSLMHYLSIHNTAYSEFYTLKTCYHSSPSTNSLNTVLAWNEIHASYPYSYNFGREQVYCMLYTISGTGTVSLNGNKIMASENTFVFLPCSPNVSIRIQSTHWNYIIFYIHGPFLSFYYELFKERYRGVVSSENMPRIEASLTSLISYMRNYIPNELIINKLLVDLLTELTCDEFSFSSGRGGKMYLEDIKSYYDTHYSEDLNLDNVSTQAGINKYRLCREFKAAYGFSPLQYLNGRRLEEAEHLLNDTDLKVHEVAERVGIENTTHFINLFKRKHKMTPAAYRNRPSVSSSLTAVR